MPKKRISSWGSRDIFSKTQLISFSVTSLKSTQEEKATSQLLLWAGDEDGQISEIKKDNMESIMSMQVSFHIPQPC
ncbi:hypothetical protein LDENG_00241600 [Lucifuga dentata]|nr:hypothetical protein LDENG_00241600 [Lucifuga dentata]